MGSIGPLEVLVVLVVALLVLGPQKLPDAARSLGRAIGEVRRYTAGFQNEIRDAFSEGKPTTSPPPVTAGEAAQVGEPSLVEPPPPSVPDNGDTPSA